jgi:uroporphyrinogen-III synthase
LRNHGIPGLLPLAISQPHSLTVPLPQATAIILTSPFAIPALQGSKLPVWCVGPSTAEEAAAANLTIAHSGMADAAALARHIASLPLPPQQFLHPHGDHAGQAWHSILTTAGHSMRPIMVYRTNRITSLPPELLPQLAQTTHTLLFSPGSAKHLAKLLKQANISPTGTAVALSGEVATAAAAFWPRVVVAGTPTLQAMAAALKKEGL